jgi:hypothetical protein
VFTRFGFAVVGFTLNQYSTIKWLSTVPRNIPVIEMEIESPSNRISMKFGKQVLYDLTKSKSLGKTIGHDFGEIQSGQAARIELSIKALGNIDITNIKNTGSNDFTLLNTLDANRSLRDGDELKLEIQYAPSDNSKKYGRIEITLGDQTVYTVNLVGGKYEYKSTTNDRYVQNRNREINQRNITNNNASNNWGSNDDNPMVWGEDDNIPDGWDRDSIYDYVGDFSEGLAVVRTGDKYGYISNTGYKVVPLIYDDAKDFKEGRANVYIKKVFSKKEWGYINKAGIEIIPTEFKNSANFSDGIAVIKDKIIDKNGNELREIQGFDYIGDFNYGLAPVKKDDKYGFIDKFGNVQIRFQFDYTGGFNKYGVALVKKEDKYYYINNNGYNFLANDYEIDLFEEDYKDYILPRFNKYGLLKVKKNDKYGFVNRNGNEIVPIDFDVLYDFGRLYTMGEKNGEYFYIDTSGTMFDDVNLLTISEGIGYTDKDENSFPLQSGGKWIIRFYDDNNNTIATIEKDYYDNRDFEFRNGMAIVEKNGKFGFINDKINEVIPCIYEKVDNFNEYGVAKVEKDGIYMYIDKNGFVIARWLENSHY